MERDLPAILIVEDHSATRRFLADNLAADGYEPLEARSASEGRRLIAGHSPELAILDLGLPDHDGLDLLREIRESSEAGGGLDSQLPVLILSGRAGELDRIRGFERGCDDYLPKPFSYGELRGRIEALLRRTRSRARLGRVRVGALEVDPVARRVWLDGEPVHLSKKEYGLLRALASEPGRVFTGVKHGSPRAVISATEALATDHADSLLHTVHTCPSSAPRSDFGQRNVVRSGAVRGSSHAWLRNKRRGRGRPIVPPARARVRQLSARLEIETRDFAGTLSGR